MIRRGLLAASLALLAAGCCQSSPAVTTPTPEQVTAFTRRTGITLPASSTPVGWHDESGIDAALWLQVRAPAASIAAFLDTPPVRGITLTPGDPSRLHDFRMFLPTAPASYRGGQQMIPVGRVLNLMLDESDPATTVVYLLWHET